MPSTTLQSRISAFESLAQASSPSQDPPTRPSSKQAPMSPPNNAQLQTPLTPNIVALLPPPKAMSASPSTPELGRKTSLIDLKDWVVDVAASSLSPNGHAMSQNGYPVYTPTPTQRSFDATEAPSITPLINLESPPKPKPKPKPKALSTRPLDSKVPPLPPRKPSYTSLQSANSSPISIHRNGSTNGSVNTPRSDTLTVEHTYPPLRPDHEGRPGHAPASSISSFHSVSLSSDTDSSTPGSISNFVATFPVDHDRESSFGNGSEGDSISLDESYENVSTPSMASPSIDQMHILDWQKTVSSRHSTPPKLPQRPSSAKVPQLPARPQPLPGGSRSIPSSPHIRPALSTASSSSTLSSLGRRPPPPPPASRSSNRSSIQSTITSLSLTSSSTTSYRTLSVKGKRPTPVPPAARVRFEAVFISNVIRRRKAERQRESEKPSLLSPVEARKTRQAAGWRGLSVDLITGDDSPVVVNKEDAQPDEIVKEEVGPAERLEGKYVKQIWNKSGLSKARLKEIWIECDNNNTGCLDRNAFVRGMWRIDEDLRRSQMQAIKSASNLSLGPLRGRSPATPITPTSWKPRPILT